MNFPGFSCLKKFTLKDLSLFIEIKQLFLSENRQVLPEFRRKLPVSFGKNQRVANVREQKKQNRTYGKR